MALLDKKDIQLLLEAGFSEDDLGLSHGSKRGVELYESPADYFAKELIENACECGECDLYDEIVPQGESEPYDTSHKGLYEDDVYDGNDDPAIDVPPEVRDQVEWLKTIKIGKMAVWQKRTGDNFKWQVKRVNLKIPDSERERLNKLSADDKKLLWKAYARDAWQELWKDAVSTLYSKRCESVRIKAGRKEYNLIVIDADDMRELGHSVPGEANWITMMYFTKDSMKPQIRPRSKI